MKKKKKKSCVDPHSRLNSREPDITGALSDGCACSRWHACISTVSLHREENRLAHEQKSVQVKGESVRRGWADSGIAGIARPSLALVQRVLIAWWHNTKAHRVSRATWPRPVPQFLGWRQKNLIWITLLSLSLLAFSETFPIGPVENPVSSLASPVFRGTFPGTSVLPIK